MVYSLLFGEFVDVLYLYKFSFAYVSYLLNIGEVGYLYRLGLLSVKLLVNWNYSSDRSYRKVKSILLPASSDFSCLSQNAFISYSLFSFASNSSAFSFICFSIARNLNSTYSYGTTSITPSLFWLSSSKSVFFYFSGSCFDNTLTFSSYKSELI